MGVNNVLKFSTRYQDTYMCEFLYSNESERNHFHAKVSIHIYVWVSSIHNFDSREKSGSGINTHICVSFFYEKKQCNRGLLPYQYTYMCEFLPFLIIVKWPLVCRINTHICVSFFYNHKNKNQKENKVSIHIYVWVFSKMELLKRLEENYINTHMCVSFFFNSIRWSWYNYSASIHIYVWVSSSVKLEHNTDNKKGINTHICVSFF